MNRKIKVSLPINIAPGDLHFYQPYASYKFPSVKVRYVKSAFATSTGLVCARNGLLKGCVHHTWEKQFEVCLAQVSQYYYAAKEYPETMLIFDDDEMYLMVHHPWHSNYYHWLTEAILRIWMVMDKTNEMILMLPSFDQLPNVAIESLQIFTFKDIIYLPKSKSALVRKLCMPELKPDLPTFIPEALWSLREMYCNHTKAKRNTNLALGKLIYISRKKAANRKIVNEAEVISVLEANNFSIVYCEDYTFFEQVSIFSNAKCLVSGHGAGLTNMLFMHEGSTILEFHKRRNENERHYALIFWRMADALGHNYYHQVCTAQNPDENFYSADLTVDLDQLQKNLNLILSNTLT